VSEPAVVALIGVAGLMVGAIMKLHGAEMALKAIHESKAWEPAGLDLAQYMTAWEQRSDALSRVLGSKDALDVDAAFSLLDAMAMNKAENQAEVARTGGPLVFTFPLDTLPMYWRHVQAAKIIIHRAAFTKREERKGDIPALDLPAIPPVTGQPPKPPASPSSS
jgi:hypothetical protein